MIAKPIGALYSLSLHMQNNVAKPKSLVKRFRGLVYQLLETISPALLQVVCKRFAHTCSENWGYRAKLVLACPDYHHFAPVPNAGKVVAGCQVMHNGLKVALGSYYGLEATRLFSRTKGIHEPQEERVFAHILPLIPPGGIIVELGAYWAFYSLWFCQAVTGGRAYLVEPTLANLEYGKKNFALNGFQGDFTQAYVGRASGVFADGTPIICVADWVREKGLQRISLLHCDIQGYELDMLKGAETLIRERRIDYYFISTHSEPVHADCETFLRERGMKVVTSIRPQESYSMDGILICVDPGAPQPAPIEVSRRPPEA